MSCLLLSHASHLMSKGCVRHENNVYFTAMWRISPKSARLYAERRRVISFEAGSGIVKSKTASAKRGVSFVNLATVRPSAKRTTSPVCGVSDLLASQRVSVRLPTLATMWSCPFSCVMRTSLNSAFRYFGGFEPLNGTLPTAVSGTSADVLPVASD